MATADPAPAASTSCRPNVSDQHTVVAVHALTVALVAALITVRLDEFDTLDNRLLDAQQGAPYPGVAHAVLRS